MGVLSQSGVRLVWVYVCGSSETLAHAHTMHVHTCIRTYRGDTVTVIRPSQASAHARNVT